MGYGQTPEKDSWPAVGHIKGLTKNSESSQSNQRVFSLVLLPGNNLRYLGGLVKIIVFAYVYIIRDVFPFVRDFISASDFIGASRYAREYPGDW